MAWMLSERRRIARILVYRTESALPVLFMVELLRSVWHKSIGFSTTVGIFFLLLVAAACTPKPADSPRFHFPWLAEAQWRSAAEIASYRGEVTRYGAARPAQLDLITVSEPFNLKQLVKAEKPDASSVTALKQNQVLSYQTGVYPYRQMNGLFWRTGDGSLLKATMTSQEWCGQTMKELRKEGDHLRFSYSSYWEDEATGTAVVRVPEMEAGERAVLYDELPLLVRTTEFRHYRKLYVFPLLMSSQVRRPDWDIGAPARTPRYLPAVSQPQAESLTIAGKTYEALRIEISWTEAGAKRVETFWVDTKSPHRTLLRWKRYDDSVFTLESQSFAPYWQLNRPGDRLP